MRTVAWLIVILVAACAAPVPVPSSSQGMPTAGSTNTPSPAVRPTALVPTALPESVRLVRLYPFEPDLLTAEAGRFFGVAATSSNAATLLRIDPDGTITRRTLADPLASYFSHAAAAGRSLYIGTSVIARFTSASDELLRVDASTLTMTARIGLPGAVVALAADSEDVWVGLADRILRLDPVSLAVRASFAIPGITPPPLGSSSLNALARGPGGLWATVRSALPAALYRFDPLSLAVLSRTDVPASGQAIQAVAGPESVWLTGQDFVRRVDASGHLSEAVPDPGLQAAAAQGRGLLALVDSSSASEMLVHVSEDGAVVASTAVGDAGAHVVVDGPDVWLQQGLSVAHWVLVSSAP